IQNILDSKRKRNYELQRLFHEVTKNGYLRDLVTSQYTKNKKEAIQIIDSKKKNKNEKLLNDKIFTILNELKILYHNDIHKQIGYPLQLHHICAVLLYCGKSCSVQLNCDQSQFEHNKWPYLDFSLQEAVQILHLHERREESETELYCRLKGVRLEDINEIKSGFFISHVSTSDDIQASQMHKSDQGCILHFHPSMRRAHEIASCDVSWISPFKYERKILFARSPISPIDNKERVTWNAKIESENEHMQMILLTWIRYNEFAEGISNIRSHSTDLNIVYLALKETQNDINETSLLLSQFDKWKKNDDNEQKYKKRRKKFIEKRCCNDDINLFCIFLYEKGYLKKQNDIEKSILLTINDGLPFVEKVKDAPFIVLPFLPILVYQCQSQCITYNNEILICGGCNNNGCYSYHIHKCKYKRICSYPSDIKLNGHCVLKLINEDNSRNITLLSFGGYPKHTLIMKYISVWNDEVEHNNEWIPLIDNNNKSIIIGTDGDDYRGVRAKFSVNLLFITYYPNNITVFDLNTFRYIKNSILPIHDRINYHCFVSKKSNNKKIHEMILFHKNTGLTIEYNETYNIFQFYNIRVCTTIKTCYSYGFVCVDDYILLFGGYNETKKVSRSIHKYSISKNDWMKFEQTLPILLDYCLVALNGNNEYIHCIGGRKKNGSYSTHMKTSIKKWITKKTEKEEQWYKKEEKQKYLEEKEKETEELRIIYDDLERMKHQPNIKEIKVNLEILKRYIFIINLFFFYLFI
ncbi:hypothetical protein RFI_32386, partial [Reticulomyxa filosa]